jgi:hypothetical protein
MTRTALLEPDARTGWSVDAVQVALWCWSTGDGIGELAELHDMSERDVRRMLAEHDVLGEGGRDRAAGISARMCHAAMDDRWTAVERDVVAVAVSRSEASLIGMREMLRTDSDIEADRAITIPLLLGLARAIDPEGDADVHWRCAGRLAHMPDRGDDALVTSRRLPGGAIVASLHDMEMAHGLILVETAPRAWMHVMPSGQVMDLEGVVGDVADMAALVGIEIGRESRD